MVKREKKFAVGLALEGVTPLFKLFFQLSEAVQLTVAYRIISVECKRLHSALVKSHYRKPVEAENSAVHAYHTRHIGSPRYSFLKTFAEFIL